MFTHDPTLGAPSPPVSRTLAVYGPSTNSRAETTGREFVDVGIREIGIQVGAGVLNHRQPEIGVGCFEQSGQDNG
jgi:hypothetical protein